MKTQKELELEMARKMILENQNAPPVQKVDYGSMGTDVIQQKLNDRLNMQANAAPPAMANQNVQQITPAVNQQAAQNPMNPYQASIDKLLQEIMNPGGFSYNAENDPLYQSYKKRYQQAGEESFQNTIGDLAGMTGGRLNTWATSAAAQAKQGWDQKLLDTVPELYQLAYGMYQDKLSNKYNQLNALQGLENTAYNRQRDLLADQRYEKEWDYGVSRDQVGDARYEKEWQYGVSRDQAADARYEKEWDYGVSRDEVADKRYADETDYNRSRDTIGDERYDEQWDYQLERDRVADDRYKTEWEYGVERDEVGDKRYEKEWDYGVGRDIVGDKRYEQQWDYQLERDRVADDRYKTEWEYNVVKDLINLSDKRDERDYQRAQDALKNEGITPPAAGDIARYNQILQGLTSTFDNPTEALTYVDKIGKDHYEQLIGETLYRQLITELQGGFGEGDTLGALYQEMMMSDNPGQWVIDNAIYLRTDELKDLLKYSGDVHLASIISEILLNRNNK